MADCNLPKADPSNTSNTIANISNAVDVVVIKKTFTSNESVN